MQPSSENPQNFQNQNNNKELGNEETTENKPDLEIPHENSSAQIPSSSSKVQKIEEELQFNKPAFAPFIVGSLNFQVNTRSFAALVFYNEKHNLIITCFTTYTVQFFNAENWYCIQDRTLKFPNSVLQISFCSESDLFLFACANGNTFIYDFPKNILTKHLENEEHNVLAVKFIDAENYAFLLDDTERLYIGNLHYGFECGFRSSFLLENKNPTFLHYLENSKTLLVSLENGEILSVKMHRLNTAPIISIIGSVCGSEERKRISLIKSVVMKGKEYVITAGMEWTMRIWHVFKGKIRLLRVIKTDDIVCRITYLEKYQIIVTTFRKNYVKFWKFVSGRLELQLALGKLDFADIFAMKEKNQLGLLNSLSNTLKIVQLHPN